MAKASRDVLPEIHVRPEMKWVTNLNPDDRALRESRRASDIESDRAAMFTKLRRLSAFDSVPDEALNFVALDMAVLATDSYENGIQVGVDWRKDIDQAELNRLHSFAHNSIQNVAG